MPSSPAPAPDAQKAAVASTPGTTGFFASFRFAASGIAKAAKGRNFKIQCAVALLAFVLCVLLKVSTTELLVVIIFVAAVLSGECLNTAIEALTDLASPSVHPLAKVAKDCAAGSVLIMSIASLVAACIIFIPKLIALIG